MNYGLDSIFIFDSLIRILLVFITDKETIFWSFNRHSNIVLLLYHKGAVLTILPLLYTTKKVQKMKIKYVLGKVADSCHIRNIN